MILWRRCQSRPGPWPLPYLPMAESTFINATQALFGCRRRQDRQEHREARASQPGKFKKKAGPVPEIITASKSRANADRAMVAVRSSAGWESCEASKRGRLENSCSSKNSDVIRGLHRLQQLDHAREGSCSLARVCLCSFSRGPRLTKEANPQLPSKESQVSGRKLFPRRRSDSK